MKKTALLLLAIAGLSTGCVVYDGPYRDDGEHHRDHERGGQNHQGDRDHDGVFDRQDRRPNDPGRY